MFNPKFFLCLFAISAFLAVNSPGQNPGTTTRAVTSAIAPGTVIVQHTNGAWNTFQASANTNVARGTALVAAVSSAGASDIINVGGGSYDIGATTLNLPATTWLNMSPTTTLLSSVTWPGVGIILYPANGCTITGGTIQGNAASGSYQAGIGMQNNVYSGETTAFTGVTVRNVTFVGDTDCVFIQHSSPCTISFYQCTFNTKWDAVTLNSSGSPAAHVVELYQCIVNSVGPTTAAGQNANRCVATQTGTIRVFGGKLTATGSGSPTDVSCAESAGSTGVVELYGVKCLSAGTNSQDINNYQSSTLQGSITAYGGNGSGTNGAFTVITNGVLTHGVHAVPFGGTGQNSLTAYAPIFGGTTSTGAVQSGTVGTAGQVLLSNGAGVLPTFQPRVTMTANTTSTITFNTATNTETIYNTSGTTIASATLTLPATTIPGQIVRYVTAGAITALTVSGTVDAGAAVTTLAANSSVAWQADATTGHFVRLY